MLGRNVSLRVQARIVELASKTRPGIEHGTSTHGKVGSFEDRMNIKHALASTLTLTLTLCSLPATPQEQYKVTAISVSPLRLELRFKGTHTGARRNPEQDCGVCASEPRESELQ